MNVSEVKTLVPESEVYALTEEAKYLIVIEKRAVNVTTLRELQEALNRTGISAILLSVHEMSDTIKIFEDSNSG